AVATVVGVSPEEVSFTPSGTVAGQLALLGAAGGRRRTGTHVVASAVEHSTVLAAARWHASAVGSDDAVTLVPVDRTGRVGAEEFASALRPHTAVASLQSANHEVGTTQPVDE